MLLERGRLIPVHRLEQPQFPLAHRSLHGLDHFRLAEIRRDPGRADIRALQPLTRQRQPHPQRRPEPWQKPSTTHIRKQTNAGLRHGKQRPLRRHPVRPMNADPDTAAHRHAIHEGGIGLRVILYPRVQPVLGPEERLRRRSIRRTAFRQHPDIPAGAESARVPGMIDDDQLDLRIGCPRLQRRIHREAHLLVQRMQSLRPTQRDSPCDALTMNDDFGHDRTSGPRPNMRPLRIPIVIESRHVLAV